MGDDHINSSVPRPYWQWGASDARRPERPLADTAVARLRATSQQHSWRTGPPADRPGERAATPTRHWASALSWSGRVRRNPGDQGSFSSSSGHDCRAIEAPHRNDGRGVNLTASSKSTAAGDVQSSSGCQRSWPSGGVAVDHRPRGPAPNIRGASASSLVAARGLCDPPHRTRPQSNRSMGMSHTPCGSR